MFRPGSHHQSNLPAARKSIVWSIRRSVPVSLLPEDALKVRVEPHIDETVIYPGKHYVYEWRDSAGTLLYIGCGKDGRAWHVRREKGSQFYNPPSCRGLQEIRVSIIVWAESRKEALRYERELIDRFEPIWNIRYAPLNLDGESYASPLLAWMGIPLSLSFKTIDGVRKLSIRSGKIL